MLELYEASVEPGQYPDYGYRTDDGRIVCGRTATASSTPAENYRMTRFEIETPKNYHKKERN